MADELLVVDDLEEALPVSRGSSSRGREFGAVKAVDGVSFSLREAETLGVVGESGCGKSTMARWVMKLLDPTDGKIVFKDQERVGPQRSQMRPLRREMMMVFQDPVRISSTGGKGSASSSPRASTSTGSARPRSGSAASASCSRSSG